MTTHIFLDTETTGLGLFANPVREDAIIEVGLACRMDNDIYTWGSICRPPKKYFEKGRADEAMKVNCITLEEIKEAPGIYDVSTELHRKISHISHLPMVDRGNIMLHSYNIPFDRTFLSKRPWLLGELTWGEDVMDLAFNHFQLPAGNKIGLARTLERLGIKPEGKPHRAVTDAVSAMLAYEKIKEIEGVRQ